MYELSHKTFDNKLKTNHVTPSYRNRLVKLNNHGVEKVNGSIAISSQKCIYSRLQLTADEIALIKKAKKID